MPWIYHGVVRYRWYFVAWHNIVYWYNANNLNLAQSTYLYISLLTCLFDNNVWPEWFTLIMTTGFSTVLPTQPNSSKFFNLVQVGFHMATHLAWVGLSWCEFDKAQIFAQLKPSFPNSHLSQLSPSCFIVVRRLCIHSCNGFLASWLNLPVPFRHPLMLRFCNLAWVGSSWEYCTVESAVFSVHVYPDRVKLLQFSHY